MSIKRTKRFLNEFKEFAVKGNVIDMGVAFIIGAAFTSIVNSLVKDIFTPVLSLFTTGMDFTNWFLLLKAGETGGPYNTLEQAQADNAVTMNLGTFVNALITFIIVAWVLFILIRFINHLKRPAEMTADPVDTRECPYCFSSILMKARRCPYCTSEVEPIKAE